MAENEPANYAKIDTDVERWFRETFAEKGLVSRAEGLVEDEQNPVRVNLGPREKTVIFRTAIHQAGRHAMDAYKYHWKS